MLPTKRPLEESADVDEEMSSNPTDINIDEVLHGRQLAVYGRETMQKFSASNVLVSGLQGLGAEIAKNLILAGVKSVTLHDEQLVDLWDLSSNFVLSEDDVGNNRAFASFQKLNQLNKSVTLSILTTQLTKQHLSHFQVVVFTDISLDKAVEFDGYCHHHQPPIAFINTQVRGLFGSVFCDFGPEFTVLDVDGEEPQTGLIVSISNDNPALITCVRTEKLEFQDGDVVVFSKVQGMIELNDGKTRKVNNVRHKSFILGGENKMVSINHRHDSWHNSFTLDEDTTNYGAYVEGGIVTQVKQPKKLHFKPLSEALGDFSKSDRPPLLHHLAFQALDKFRAEFGRFPEAGSEDDAQKLISIFGSINDSCADGKIKEIDQNLLRCFAFGARAVLNPMAAMFGGIVAQEVLKACSGKFHPLFQFFYFDSVESLPTKHPSADDVRPRNSRYDAQISVFGSKLQKKLEMAQVFIVGAGALGCEFLKNVALMGVCCGDDGKLAITDDDLIEKSNLSTQFLFRDCDVGQEKSVVAATAARSINPRFHVEAHKKRASEKTENVFDYRFWGDLKVVISAVDNVNSRLYIDERCVRFGKPLLECGTLGAKCSTQMVIPHLSDNYGASCDPPEKDYRKRGLPDSPYNIDYWFRWAVSEFELLLWKTPSEVNQVLETQLQLINVDVDENPVPLRDMLRRVLECLVDKPESFRDCITWARSKFEDYFAHRINQSREHMSVSKKLFWSAPQRYPHPLKFSADDSSHMEFVMAASILRAKTFGIPIPDWIKDPQMPAGIAGRVDVPEFKHEEVGPKIDPEILDRCVIAEIHYAHDIKVIGELIQKLKDCISQLPQGFKMNPIQLDMGTDDVNKYEVEMIAGLVNMSARSYGIPEVDKLKAKLMAGRVVPAIATSTAMATGLVCLELYKVLDEEHKLEDYRNAFANLALPLFSMAEPLPAKVVNHGEMSWTVWDRWILEGNPTVEQLLDWLQREKNVTAISIIKYKGTDTPLYMTMYPKHMDRIDKKLLDLTKELAPAELPLGCNHFDLRVISHSIKKVPTVSVYFQK